MSGVSPRLTGVLLAGLVALVAVSSFLALDVAGRDLVDTDGYMRFERVSDLMEGESAWFEGDAPRSNAPFGHTMHWTRPLDALAVAAATPLRHPSQRPFR